MYCPDCGARIEEGQSYCSSCGRVVRATAAVSQGTAAPYRGRVAQHLQVVAILWIVWSILDLARGAAFLFFRGSALHFIPFSFPERTWMFPMAAIAATAGTVGLAYGVIGIVAAWGLFQRLRWARVLALIVAFLSLIHIPFGTGLGIYTLWVLLPAQSGEEYSKMCPPA
jgi:uncharacterized membrane protein (DUF2068 family)